MTSSPQDSPRQRTDKRKGLLLALLLHGAVVGGFIYPFLLSQERAPSSYETLVELDFREPPLTAANASSSERMRNDVKQAKLERAAPQRTPTASLPTSPAPPPTILTDPTATPTSPEATPDEVPTSKPSTAPAVVNVPTTQSTRESDAYRTSTGTETSTGAPEAGDGASVSDAGSGRADAGEGLSGTGVLRRAVVYRPQLHSVVRSNGRISINVCVDQRGNVVAVKWNKELSTITETATVREALDKATDYKFERDGRAPNRECGILTIIVKGLDKLN